MAKKKAAPKPAEEPPAEEQPTPPAEENNRCFIITPIGDENSEVRRATDGLVDAVIKPVAKRLGLVVEVAHRSFDPRSITRRIVEHVVESRVVIANLTGLNPNVMYELAIRHAAGKPVVVIAERGTRLPFDVKDELTFFYEDDMRGAVDLRETLEFAVAAATDHESPDNPITRYRQEALIDLKGDPPDALSIVLDRLDNIESMVARSRRPPRISKRAQPRHDYVFRATAPGIKSFVKSVMSGLEERYPTISVSWKIGVDDWIEVSLPASSAIGWAITLETFEQSLHALGWSDQSPIDFERISFPTLAL